MRSTLFCALLLSFSVSSAHAATLTLADALANRAATSRILKISALDEQIAGDNVLASRSGYLPRVDAQGGYIAQLAPQSISSPLGSFETQDADFGFFSLGISQTLYDFGRTDARYSRAREMREATRFNRQSLEQGLFLQTVTSYFRVLQEQKLLKAAAEETAQMADHLRIAQNLFEQGVVTRNDLLQAEVRLASSRQRRLEVANRLENAWLDLNNQMGEPPDFRKDLVEESRIDPTELNKTANGAVDGRPEILAQRKLLAAGEMAVKETRNSYFPEIFAKANLDYVQNSKVTEQVIMSATVGLKINLFDGFTTTSQYRQAVKSRSQAEERLHQMESDLALEYRTAVNDARVAKQRISLTEESIKQGEENLRINKDRYQEQVGTATEVIDAQTLLTQIRTEYYQALFDYQVACARVKRAEGLL